MSVSPHKNANNEYFVHTEPIPNVVKTDTWSLFGTSENNLEKELKECKLQYRKLNRNYDKLQVEFKNYTETMEEVANELKCLKVHHYFLQMHVCTEQKSQMHREKTSRREKLQKCIDDAQYRSTNKNSLKSETNELNKYMQERHDDADDQAIMTNTTYIKNSQMVDWM